LFRDFGENKAYELLVFLARNFSYKEIRELIEWSSEVVKKLMETSNIKYRPSVSLRHRTLYFLKKPLSEILKEALNIKDRISNELKKIQKDPTYFKALYHTNPIMLDYILAYLLYIKQESATEIAKILKIKHKTTILNVIKKLGLTTLGIVKQKRHINVSKHGLMYAKRLYQKEAEELEKIHQQIIERKITYQQIEVGK